MKRLIYILMLQLAAIAAASCAKAPVTAVNLYEYDRESLDPKTCFIPYGDREDTVIDEETFNGLGLPCGQSIGEATGDESATKTTAISGVSLAKNILSTVNAKSICSYCGTYYSEDQYGQKVLVSGRIVLPSDGKVSRLMLVSHFTIGADSEAPSNELPLESIFASRGIAVIESDYIGYGVSRNRVHPYLCSELTARNVVDMYYASLPFLKAIGVTPEYEDIFLLGFSQGGANTIATLKYIQEKELDIKVRLTLAGSGPYDICATYDTMIKNNYTDYPCAIPLIVQGMKVGMQLDNLDFNAFFKPYIVENMDSWINSKRFVMKEITELMGTKYISDIMTEQSRDKASEMMSDFYRAMMENSLTEKWVPLSSIYMFHSIEDNVVPFVNAENFQNNLGFISNIHYNFGYYGNHVISCLRFLLSAMELLQRNGDIQ